MNYALDTDLYQLTMMQSHFQRGKTEGAVFDVFFRRIYDDGKYALFAGLEQVIHYINNLSFTDDDLSYLASLKSATDQPLFKSPFLEYLRGFRFTGNMHAFREGSVVFPNEPLIRIEAPLLEAQLVETAMLSIINSNSISATKAARIMDVVTPHGAKVMEFGLRRAHGIENGLQTARAAYIGGMHSTSNVRAGQLLGIPVSGTHAHSYVQSYTKEIDAFRAYAEDYPDNTILLVDTYDTIAGIEKAIVVLQELKAVGHKPLGIRLDSGDIITLSNIARKMLDEAMLDDVPIVVSGDLDEEVIRRLYEGGAKMDSLGVGTKLYYTQKAFGAVYKLAAINKQGTWLPLMKVSEERAKQTTPGIKEVHRLYDFKTGQAVADVIGLAGEAAPSASSYYYSPDDQRIGVSLENYRWEALLLPIFINGRQVYEIPPLPEVRQYSLRHRAIVSTYTTERLLQDRSYPVLRTKALFQLQQQLIAAHTTGQ